MNLVSVAPPSPQPDESRNGNDEQVARIGDGCPGRGGTSGPSKVTARPDQQSCREADSVDRLKAGSPAHGFTLARMTRLENQKRITCDTIHSMFNRFDSSQQILQRPGMVDGRADEPDEGQRDRGEDNDPSRIWQQGNATEKSHNGCSGRRDATVQSAHSEFGKPVKHSVLCQENADLVQRIEFGRKEWGILWFGHL